MSPRPKKNAEKTNPPKRRGRPPKIQPASLPKRRGRPPKIQPALPKRRGRPPKNPKNPLGSSPLRTKSKREQIKRVMKQVKRVMKPRARHEKKDNTAEGLFCSIVELCEELFKRGDFEDFVASVPPVTSSILMALYDYVHPQDDVELESVPLAEEELSEEDTAPEVQDCDSGDFEDEDVSAYASSSAEDADPDAGDEEFLNKPETETLDGSLLAAGTEENIPDRFLDAPDRSGMLGHTDDESGE